jgi:diketogulonate reductase-like aldo/keto reductase
LQFDIGIYDSSRIPRDEIWVPPKLGPTSHHGGHIQEGTIVFPKLTNLQHIWENLGIFSPALDDAAIQKIKVNDRISGRLQET